ncbi:hypothetical protein DFH06DRAFT_1118299 [Mycena polygramma]|nr:hypothetical protein DFH06DRAFT_1118299 [Mycena polygramma]
MGAVTVVRASKEMWPPSGLRAGTCAGRVGGRGSALRAITDHRASSEAGGMWLDIAATKEGWVPVGVGCSGGMPGSWAAETQTRIQIWTHKTKRMRIISQLETLERRKHASKLLNGLPIYFSWNAQAEATRPLVSMWARIGQDSMIDLLVVLGGLAARPIRGTTCKHKPNLNESDSRLFSGIALSREGQGFEPWKKTELGPWAVQTIAVAASLKACQSQNTTRGLQLPACVTRAFV